MWRRVAPALAALLLTVAACGQGTGPNASTASSASSSSASNAQQTPVKGGTLTVGLDVQPLGLDPAKQSSATEWRVMQLAYETLIVKDSHGAYQPLLATSWDTSKDGLTYTFHLRQGVHFQDGETMTSADVKFSFDRMLQQGTPYVTSLYKSLKSVDAPDPDTVVFHLNKIQADFLNLLSNEFVVGSAIVSKKVAQANVDLSHEMVGTGPYQMVKWVPGDQMVLKRFPQYWNADKVGYLDQIVLKFIPDVSSQLAALRAGQIQLMFPDGVTAQLAQRDAKLVTQKAVGEWRDGLGFNTLHKPFDDVRVRQAVMFAIDREAIAQESLNGQGAPTGALPLTYPGAPPLSELPSYSKDLAKAKDLLSQAGLAGGFSFHLLLPNNFPVNVRQGEILQQQLKPLGINVSLDKLEWGDFLKRLNSATYDAAVYPYASYPDVEQYLIPRPGRAGPMPQAMADLFAKGESETDPQQRLAIYTQIAKLQAEDGFPIAWLVAHNVFAAMQPQVKGFELSPTGSLRGLWTTWLGH